MRQWFTALSLILLLSTPAFAADDFNWMDEKGKAYSLTELQGKPLILHLWASWCPPCRSEMKDFSLWIERNPAVNVIMVSLDSRSQDAASFLKAQNINRPVLLSDAAEARKLGARALPTTIVVAADGSISQLYRGPRKWSDENFSNRVLKQLQP